MNNNINMLFRNKEVKYRNKWLQESKGIPSGVWECGDREHGER